VGNHAFGRFRLQPTGDRLLKSAAGNASDVSLTSAFPLADRFEDVTLAPPPTIFVVDDDPGVSRTLESAGQLLRLPVAPFATAREFLASYDRSQPGCLVLELTLPDMSGIELQQRLIHEQTELPIIMISGHASVRIAVEVMSRGAVTLLEKPLCLNELIVHLRKALDLDAARRASRAKQAKAQLRLSQLTPRDREVLDLIAAGRSNKQIAAHLGLSLRAIEDRRARLMKRIGALSLAEALHLWSQRDTASAGTH
jgi:FixJ family two-component response regulator